jgi:deoxycytidine triphosphate deaminase
MLSQNTILTMIGEDKLFSSNAEEKVRIKEKVQSASIDLTIEHIFSAKKGLKLSCANKRKVPYA